MQVFAATEKQPQTNNLLNQSWRQQKYQQMTY